jgi:soluble lytic murein transglycosylase
MDMLDNQEVSERVISRGPLTPRVVNKKSAPTGKNWTLKDWQTWVTFGVAFAVAGTFSALTINQLHKLSTFNRPASVSTVNPAVRGEAAEEEAVPFIKPVKIPEQYRDIVMDAAERYGLDPALIAGVIQTESHWNPHARSGKDCVGIMQISASTEADTAKRLGLQNWNIMDVGTNIDFGTNYLKWLGDRPYINQDVVTMLAAYNWGPENVRKLALKDISIYDAMAQGLLPRETENYIKKILNYSYIEAQRTSEETGISK